MVVVIDEFALVDALLLGESVPAGLQVGDISRVFFIVLLEQHFLVLECLGHGAYLD